MKRGKEKQQLMLPTFHRSTAPEEEPRVKTSFAAGTTQSIAEVIRGQTSFTQKRERDADGPSSSTGSSTSLGLQHVTHSMLASGEHRYGVEWDKRIVLREGTVVALLEPNPMGLVHITILATEQKQQLGGERSATSSSSSSLSSATSWDAVDTVTSASWQSTLASMWAVKKKVLNSFASVGACHGLLESRLGAAHPQTTAFRSTYTDLASQRKTKKEDPVRAMTVPFRVVAFLTPVRETFNLPVLHIVSAEASYCQQSVSEWRSLMIRQRHQPDVVIDIGPLDVFVDFLKRYTTTERPSVMKMVGIRKRLMRAGDAIGCCLCPKTCSSLEEVVAHWRGECLPRVLDIVKDGVPCVL